MTAYHDRHFGDAPQHDQRFNLRVGGAFHTWDTIKSLVLRMNAEDDVAIARRILPLATSVQFFDNARKGYEIRQYRT